MSDVMSNQANNVGTTFENAEPLNKILMRDLLRLVHGIQGQIATSLNAHLLQERDVDSLYDDIQGYSEVNIDMLAADYWVPADEEEELAFLSMRGEALDSYLNSAFQDVSEMERVELDFTVLRLRVSGFAYRQLLKDTLEQWMGILLSDFDDSIGAESHDLKELHEHLDKEDDIYLLLERHVRKEAVNLMVSFA